MTQDDLISIFCLPAARKKQCVSKQSDINFLIYVPFFGCEKKHTIEYHYNCVFNFRFV